MIRFSNVCQLVEDSDNATARLYLHPGNRMSKPLQATNRGTNNVLLKVTVPKRTGLKRRKGSRGPYYEGLDDVVQSEACTKRQKKSSMTRDARHLLQTMRDNPATYQVQVTGIIERTHRFRGNRRIMVSKISAFVLMTGRVAGLCDFHCQHAFHEEVAGAHPAI